jgi:hypothetical protein
MGEIKLVCLAQLCEEELVEALEDASLLPFVEATPARHPGAVTELLRESLPGDPGREHEQDPGEDSAVVETLSARISVSAV